jgi:tRNA(fMet)-specific endonuclease VapC
MMKYILDTDHISLFQRGHAQVIKKLSLVDMSRRAVTIVTLAEQVQGRLAVIRRAQTEGETARSFENLQNTIYFYQAVQVLPYDDAAVAVFEKLREQKIRIGTQDMRIAAIALSHQATLVTRNVRDFSRVPDLFIEDWSL